MFNPRLYWHTQHSGWQPTGIGWGVIGWDYGEHSQPVQDLTNMPAEIVSAVFATNHTWRVSYQSTQEIQGVNEDYYWRRCSKAVFDEALSVRDTKIIDYTENLTALKALFLRYQKTIKTIHDRECDCTMSKSFCNRDYFIKGVT